MSALPIYHHNGWRPPPWLPPIHSRQLAANQPPALPCRLGPVAFFVLPCCTCGPLQSFERHHGTESVELGRFWEHQPVSLGTVYHTSSRGCLHLQVASTQLGREAGVGVLMVWQLMRQLEKAAKRWEWCWYVWSAATAPAPPGPGESRHQQPLRLI